MRFRPTFWATVIAVPVLVILVGLGTWQVQRLQWKNDLIENRSARVSMPMVSPGALADARDGMALAALEYRPVALEGRYVGEASFRLLPRVRNGQQGFHAISLLDAGEPIGRVLVDRGWAPLDTAENLRPVPGEPVRVEGFVRLFVTPGMFVPENEPAANNWFSMDEAAMRVAAGVPPGPPASFFVQAGPNNSPPGTFPEGSVPDVNLRNSHLEYAVTWYAFAIVFLVIFVMFHWQRRET